MISLSEAPARGIAVFAPSFVSPAENLACDEALLEFCEQDSSRGWLRFYESSSYFAVLGYGKKWQEETFAERCEALNIPILRRCSGGGTVLQGPGCFNYAMALPIDAAPELETIHGANRFIMMRVQRALTGAIGRAVQIEGYTDLALADRKFSGNAQRRKKHALLFHGSFLRCFDLDLITRTLRSPAQQPEYRAQRSHKEFLTNLNVEAKVIEEAIRAEWHAERTLGSEGIKEIERLTAELKDSKYSSAEWNERF